MWQFFADNPWVTVFAVIALGALLGLARFGPVRLGAAGVLFVGLSVGALDEDIAAAVPPGVSALGLALYVYTVGLESGPSFFRELRGQRSARSSRGSGRCCPTGCRRPAWRGSRRRPP